MPSKGTLTTNKDFNNVNSLSLTYAKCVEGICCIFVILHHLSDYVDALAVCKYIGYLPVSVFLFYSGYGLTVSAQKKEKYSRKLALIRIPCLVFSYILANILYFAVRYCTGELVKTSIAGYLFGGGALVTYSWYIICILYLYFLYWICITLCRKQSTIIVLETVFVLIWMTAMIKAGGGVHRYNSVFCFLFGCITADNVSVRSWFQRKEYILPTFLLFCTLFTVATACRIANSVLMVPFMMCASIVFAAFAVLVAETLRKAAMIQSVGKRGGIIPLLGRISLEFYLYQGMMMICFRNDYLYISNDLLFCVLVFVLTLVCAYILHEADSAFKNGWKKIVKKILNYK